MQGVNRSQLIGPQEPQLIGLNIVGTLRFVLPARFVRVAGPLRQHDVIVADRLIDETLRIGSHLLIAHHRIRCGERGDDVGVAPVQVPEIMQIAVREDDEAAILRAGIFASLLLADERILIFRFGLKDDEGEPLGIEQQEINKALCGFLKVVAEGV